ncbi:Lrp/AsnC family transcriptional regulator [Acinetobacter ursingii]|uniref:Lrp/AsnC family transcriptional regulator n=1 Tax=Acinetobacter ursingii TaxID=108980 RepID=UPI00124C9AB5|nr:Lrp/AsnC family transcriptional regulator [Acinetobacter ursingii]
MKIYSTGHTVVDQIGSLNIEGNVIPTSWFNTFKLENGKPDTNAVILLSEIVYWHRPTTVRDEDTGQIIEVKKKFKADLLQRSYQSLADQFGFSKQQVKEAMDRLEKFGVIKRHFRTIEAGGQKLTNVLFIELNTHTLFEVTTLPISKGTPSPFQNDDPPHFKEGTNTENTTEITTDSKLCSADLEKLLKGKKPCEALQMIGLNADVAKRFNDHRKALKKPLTLEAVIKHYHESCNAGISTNDAARIVLSESWIGFANRYNWKPVFEGLEGSVQQNQGSTDGVAGAWAEL